MRLISWNLRGQTKRIEAQVCAIAEREPDIVALQEVLPTTHTLLTGHLAQKGLAYSAESFSVSKVASRYLRGPRRYGLLVATRWPIGQVQQLPVPWHERTLSLSIGTPSGPLELHTTHIPPGVSNGWIKIRMLEGIFRGLACPCPSFRVLCGDFNTPQEETIEGEVITWAQRRTSLGWTLQKNRGKRWYLGEHNVLVGLAKFDLGDVYRTLHGYPKRDFSWVWQKRVSRRFDHIFASRALNPVSCEYLHGFRMNGLSDHSPIEVDFKPVN